MEYNSSEYKKESDISRRSFLFTLLTASATVIVPTANAIGRNNQERVSQALRTNYLNDLELRIEQEKAIEDLNETIKEIKEKEHYKIKEQYLKVRNNELTNPAEYSLTEGSDTLKLARILFGEFRGQANNTELLEWAGSVPITRANLSKKSLHEIINSQNAFTSLNEDNPNRKYVINPLIKAKNYPLDINSWEKCYTFAENFLQNGETKSATHFCTNTPYWAENIKPVKVIDEVKFYYIPRDFQ